MPNYDHTERLGRGCASARRPRRSRWIIAGTAGVLLAGALLSGAWAAAPCPVAVDVTAGSGGEADYGWTGFGHDQPLTALDLRLQIESCAGTTQPSCGECDVSGPLPLAGAVNRRCVGDPSIPCATDADCVADGPCVVFAGPPSPISAGGVPLCVTSIVTDSVTGTIDVEAGSLAADLPLRSQAHVGLAVGRPCPTCEAGTCSGGARTGLPCDPHATSPFYGDTSFECPPAAGTLVGTIINTTVPLASSGQTVTLSAASPSCTAGGATSQRCFCETCNNAAWTPCLTDADCVAAGATICGGPRCLPGGPNEGTPCTTPGSGDPACLGGLCGVPGEPTRPNTCSSGVCTAVGGGEGECAAPLDGYCQPAEPFRACAVDSDCPVPGDTCVEMPRECYPDNGVIGGSVSVSGAAGPPAGSGGAPTLGALFCGAPTPTSSGGAVNAIFGLPGLTRWTLPATTTLVGAPVGPCPTAMEVDIGGAAAEADLGWSGLVHDQPLVDWSARLGIAGCAGTTQPSCGTCNVTGLLPDTGGSHLRCAGKRAKPCTSDAECGGFGPCRFFMSPPMPIAAGGVGLCLTNSVIGAIGGTVDVEAGALELSLPLRQEIFGPTIPADHPCPTCDAGLCNGGSENGLACTVHAVSPLFGNMSFDCPPDPPSAGTFIRAAVPVVAASSSQSVTLSAASPSCTAAGFTSQKCFCQTCDNLAATPCLTDADCVAVGATICGGKRCIGGGNDGDPCAASSDCGGMPCGVLGEPTRPNTCAGGTCTPVGGGEGECASPMDGYCQPAEPFRACVVDSDCPVLGDTCVQVPRECYPDNGVIGGSISVVGLAAPPIANESDGLLGALFCIPPSSGPFTGLNVAAGLPGPGRLRLPAHLTFAEETVVVLAAANGTVTTDTEGAGGTPDGASPSDPVETSVTTPNAGEVSIVETFLSGSPSGFVLLGREVRIEAPPASVADPLTIVFLLDGSLLPAGDDETTVTVLKDGVAVPDCTGAPQAIPDPCIAERTTAGDDVRLTILTSSASDWSFGLVAGCDLGDGECLQCARTIAKETSKLVKARLKALQKCEETKLKGKGAALDPPFADCVDDAATQANILKASSKLDAKIDKACGGTDRLCNGTSVDEIGGLAVGIVETCPDLEMSGCTNAVGGTRDCGGVATCLECIATLAVDQTTKLSYASFAPTDPVADAALNKCQRAIGKEVAKFVLAKEKTLAKCWDARLKGKHDADCPDADADPFTAADAVKAAVKIARAESKKIAKICKACGGPGRACRTDVGPVAGDGLADDFTASDILLAAGPCPAVTVPGGQDCSLIGGGTVDDLEEVIECLDCVAEFKVDCVDAARVSRVKEYPGECNQNP